MDSNDLLFKYIAIAVILAWRDFRIQQRGQRKEELNVSGLHKDKNGEEDRHTTAKR